MKTLLNRILGQVALTASQFNFQDYDPNQLAHTIINSLVGILTLAGIVVGGVFLFLGFMNEDPKEKRNGIIGMLASLIIGGLIITITNLVIGAGS